MALALLDVQVEDSHLVAHGLQGHLETTELSYLWLREGNNGYGEKWQWLIFQHVSLKTSISKCLLINFVLWLVEETDSDQVHGKVAS